MKMVFDLSVIERCPRSYFEDLKTPLFFPPTLTPTISLDIIRLVRVYEKGKCDDDYAMTVTRCFHVF